MADDDSDQIRALFAASSHDLAPAPGVTGAGVNLNDWDQKPSISRAIPGTPGPGVRLPKELINDFVKVNGKAGSLFRIAEAVHDDPDGTIRDVVFPVASEEPWR